MSAMVRIRRLRGLLVKETLQIVRDPSSILIAGFLPLILLFLFGYGISLDARNIRIAVIVEEPSAAAESLAAAFEGSPFFDPVFGKHRGEFEQGLVDGRLRGLIVIPQDFEKRVAAGDRAPIQVITDGSEPNLAGYVQNYAQGVVASWLAIRNSEEATAVGPPINIEHRIRFNAEVRSRNFLVPGSVVLIMTLIGTLLTALVIAREWERGTMEAMMATPVSIVDILIGKLLPYYLLGMGSMALCVGVAVFLYDVPLRGSFAVLALVTTVFLVTMLGFGLLISTASKNQFVASQVALLTGFLPAVFLSGFVFEISSMPAPIQTITYIIPARYFATSLITVFLAGDIWGLLLPNMGAMALLGSIIFIAVGRKTKARLD
jgi:ABC-2 type transport system permease protein